MEGSRRLDERSLVAVVVGLPGRFWLHSSPGRHNKRPLRAPAHARPPALPTRLAISMRLWPERRPNAVPAFQVQGWPSHCATGQFIDPFRPKCRSPAEEPAGFPFPPFHSSHPVACTTSSPKAPFLLALQPSSSPAGTAPEPCARLTCQWLDCLPSHKQAGIRARKGTTRKATAAHLLRKNLCNPSSKTTCLPIVLCCVVPAEAAAQLPGADARCLGNQTTKKKDNNKPKVRSSSLAQWQGFAIGGNHHRSDLAVHRHLRAPTCDQKEFQLETILRQCHRFKH